MGSFGMFQWWSRYWCLFAICGMWWDTTDVWNIGHHGFIRTVGIDGFERKCLVAGGWSSSTTHRLVAVHYSIHSDGITAIEFNLVGGRLEWFIGSHYIQLCLGDCDTRVVIRTRTTRRCTNGRQLQQFRGGYIVHADRIIGCNGNTPCGRQYVRVDDVGGVRYYAVTGCQFVCICHCRSGHTVVQRTDSTELDGIGLVLTTNGEYVSGVWSVCCGLDALWWPSDYEIVELGWYYIYKFGGIHFATDFVNICRTNS